MGRLSCAVATIRDAGCYALHILIARYDGQYSAMPDGIPRIGRFFPQVNANAALTALSGGMNKYRHMIYVP
jgi:hypothetical protein